MDSNTPVAVPMPVPKEPIGSCGLGPFKVGHLPIVLCFFLGGGRGEGKGEMFFEGHYHVFLIRKLVVKQLITDVLMYWIP